jgi:hypothetical protein
MDLTFVLSRTTKEANAAQVAKRMEPTSQSKFRTPQGNFVPVLLREYGGDVPRNALNGNGLNDTFRISISRKLTFKLTITNSLIL